MRHPSDINLGDRVGSRSHAPPLGLEMQMHVSAQSLHTLAHAVFLSRSCHRFDYQHGHLKPSCHGHVLRPWWCLLHFIIGWSLQFPSTASTSSGFSFDLESDTCPLEALASSHRKSAMWTGFILLVVPTSVTRKGRLCRRVTDQFHAAKMRLGHVRESPFPSFSQKLKCHPGPSTNTTPVDILHDTPFLTSQLAPQTRGQGRQRDLTDLADLAYQSSR